MKIVGKLLPKKEGGRHVVCNYFKQYYCYLTKALHRLEG